MNSNHESAIEAFARHPRGYEVGVRVRGSERLIRDILAGGLVGGATGLALGPKIGRPIGGVVVGALLGAASGAASHKLKPKIEGYTQNVHQIRLGDPTRVPKQYYLR